MINEENRKEGNNMVLEFMELDAVEHGVDFTRVSLENLLCPHEEDDVVEVATFE